MACCLGLDSNLSAIHDVALLSSPTTSPTLRHVRGMIVDDRLTCVSKSITHCLALDPTSERGLE
jgi:hypothetical protein